MFHPRLLPAVLLLVMLASCGPEVAFGPLAVSTPTETPVPHAPEIHFALIGEVTDANVWALFDAKGYSYNNYAVKSDYWPRLYRLSIPDRQFEPMAASGMSSAVQQEGDFYTATVPLRSDLTWSDGSPFTAEDVAFTVNTALSFQLGFDWRDSYNPDWLDHAEAVDAHTVKFYFKKTPDVAVWQYGALQGPLVQKSYWSSRVAAPKALLPSSDLSSQIEALKMKVADLQKQVDALNASSEATIGEEARQTQASLTRQEGDLDKAMNDLSKAVADFDSAMNAARASLYALSDLAEPRLGTWEYGGSESHTIENVANLKFPLEHPNFDRAVYKTYPSEDAALSALLQGEVDVILSPNGLSSRNWPGNFVPLEMESLTHSLRFLVFNPLSEAVSDPALHQALTCMLDQEQLIRRLSGQAMSLASYVLPQETFWYNADAPLPCKGLDPASRLALAIQILKSAGYTWTQEPGGGIPAQGLALPNGDAFPAVNLIASSSDALRVAAASYVQQQARVLGIPLSVQLVTSDEINYLVLSSHRYDMAILGWRVSAYPDYLCDWFGEGNPFHYSGSRLQSACEALNSTSDLDAARQQVYEVQSVLAQEIPFIPLYSSVNHDAYRNVMYPFRQMLDGLSGVYGAPALAVPISQ